MKVIARVTRKQRCYNLLDLKLEIHSLHTYFLPFFSFNKKGFSKFRSETASMVSECVCCKQD